MKRIALFLLLPLAATAGELKVTVRAAFGGVARSGEWTGVRVEVENTADAATLEARLEGPDAISVRDITAPPSSHRVHWIPVRASTRLTCTIRRDGKTILEQPVTLTMVKSSCPLALFVAETTLGAYADDKMQGVLGVPGEIPDFSDAFEAFDLVVVRFPCPVLSPEQFEALRRWTLNGGFLMVCGGIEAPSAGASPLGALLPVRVLGVTSAESLAELASGIPLPASPFPVAEFDLLPGAEPAAFGGDRPAGLGRCRFLGLDPHLRPVSDWGFLNDFWRELTPVRQEEAERSRRLPDRFELTEGRYREFAPLGLAGRSVSMNWFFGLLVAYLIVIGPVDYFLLRKAGRLPWTWVTLPVAVVSFCAAAWILAARDPERRDYVTVVGVIDVWPDAVRERSLWMLSVPTPGIREIGLEASEARLRPIESDGRRSLRRDKKEDPIVFRSGSRSAIENLALAAWTTQTVLALVDHRPDTFGLRRQGTRWEMRAPGKLEGCVLQSKLRTLYTGDLAPGDLLPEAAAGAQNLLGGFEAEVASRFEGLLRHKGDAAFHDPSPHEGRRMLTGWLTRPPVAPAFPGQHTLRARYFVRIHLEETP